MDIVEVECTFRELKQTWLFPRVNVFGVKQRRLFVAIYYSINYITLWLPEW